MLFKFIPKTVGYQRIHDLQAFLVKQRVQQQLKQDLVLFCEHPPTYTVGRRIKHYEQETYLKSLGADFLYTKRGGDITFHGPGQLVVYPILNIKESRIGPRCYVDKLEHVVIQMLKNFDITGTRTKDTGIWINNEKIAAIGIQIQRHVTSHGLSLNCDTNLAWFDNIVPCGLKGLGVTSITNQLNAKVDVQQALPLMMASMEEAFSMKFEPMTANIDTMINDFISKPGEY